MNDFKKEALITILKEFNITKIFTKREKDELKTDYVHFLIFFEYKGITFNTYEKLPAMRHNGKKLSFEDIRQNTKYNILETLQFAEEALFKKREQPTIDIKRKLIENTAAICEDQLLNLHKMNLIDGVFKKNDPKVNTQLFIERTRKLFNKKHTPLEIFNIILNDPTFD